MVSPPSSKSSADGPALAADAALPRSTPESTRLLSPSDTPLPSPPESPPRLGPESPGPDRPAPERLGPESPGPERPPIAESDFCEADETPLIPESSIDRAPDPPAFEIPLPPSDGEDAPTIDSMARSSLSRSSPRTLSPSMRSAPESPPGEESESPELLFEALLPFPTPVSEADGPLAWGVVKIDSAPSSRISWSSSSAAAPARSSSRTSPGRSSSSSSIPEAESSPRVRTSRSTSSVLNLIVAPSRIGNSFLRSTRRLTSSTETPRSRAASSGDMNLPAMAALTGAGDGGSLLRQCRRIPHRSPRSRPRRAPPEWPAEPVTVEFAQPGHLPRRPRASS